MTQPAEEMLTDYAARVRDHFRTHLPKRYAAVPEEERAPLFEALGEEIDQAVTDLAATIAGPTPEDELYEETVKRLESARRDAESDVLREMLPMDDRLPSDVPDDPSEEMVDDPTRWLSRDPDGESAEE